MDHHQQEIIANAHKILTERNSRKKSEVDAHLLSNRIQHLKDEVARAARRTKEVDERSHEIEEQKKRDFNARLIKSKPKTAMVKRVAVEEGKFGTWVPGGLRASAVKAKNEMISAKEISRLRSEKDKVILNSNRSKIESVRKKREDLAAAKAKEDERKVAKAKELYALKIIMEEKKRVEAEAVVGRLEEEEERLIGVLKKQQEQQKKAYDKLQAVIMVEREEV